MGVLPDWMIEEGVEIAPFAQQQHRPGVISYGLTSYGYDARVGRKFKICKTPLREYRKSLPGSEGLNADDLMPIIDPKHIECDVIFADHEGDYCIIPPHGFALAETVESFFIPRGVLAVCLGKSTYARCGIIVNVTPLEPEWIGRVTVEISNTTPFPVKVYAGEGIMQVLFLQGVKPCKVSYADKGGKYQHQRGVTLPIVK